MSIEFRNASKEIIAFFANIDTEKANRVVLCTVALDVESIEDADGRQYVQVVRCRDCKHMHTVRSWLGMDVDECWLHAEPESGALGKEPTEPDGFCAWAERRQA